MEKFQLVDILKKTVQDSSNISVVCAYPLSIHAAVAVWKEVGTIKQINMLEGHPSF